jgi:metal-dependent hydrolase (beta-lactamase superfamily II)
MVLGIRTLVEDTVEKPDLIWEHGLSLLSSTPDGDILFDTGQGAALVRNTVRMGVDWKRVTSIVLSHGHYDHTDGLASVLAETGARPVFAHPSAFAPKHSRMTGELRSIGMPASRETLEGAGMQLRTYTEPVEIAPGVLATGPDPPRDRLRAGAASLSNSSHREIRSCARLAGRRSSADSRLPQRPCRGTGLCSCRHCKHVAVRSGTGRNEPLFPGDWGDASDRCR